MKNKLSVQILFLVLVLTQIGVPVWMIGRQEYVLAAGTVYKFKTAPIDPYDAFRGKYVALNIEQNRAPYFGHRKLQRDQTVYAQIEVDSLGFAFFSEVSLEKPVDKPYLKTRFRRKLCNDDLVLIRIPFDRYYLNENKASKAEALYREHSRVGKQDAYIAVRILDGAAALEELYIGGKPVLEALEE